MVNVLKDKENFCNFAEMYIHLHTAEKFYR